ncbi:MAG: class IV adenylate cyclase [Bacteroidota bacterium]
MSLNLELKASIDSVDIARRIALEAGAEPGGILMQVDTYFSVPHGRLKLRVINGTSAELIGYDRKEQEEERWSTYEKTPVPQPDVLEAILGATLGTLVVVRKRRELFWYEGSRIHIDLVEGLGAFLEFEVPTRDKSRAAESMRKLRDLFKIPQEEIFRESYSDLLIEQMKRRKETNT